MSSVVMDKPYKIVGSVLDSFHFSNQKSVSTIKEVICVISDKKSVVNSKELIKSLVKIHDDIIDNKESIGIQNVQDKLNYINVSLLKINAFFEVFNNLFDHSENEVIIDDKHAIEVLANLNTAKEKIEYISEFLKCVLDVQKSKLAIKEKKASKYTYDKDKKFLKVA